MDLALAPVIHGADGLYQGARYPILPENPATGLPEGHGQMPSPKAHRWTSSITPAGVIDSSESHWCDSEESRKAINGEVQSLNANKTFTATILAKHMKTEGGKWVYVIKTADGKNIQSRACCQGLQLGNGKMHVKTAYLHAPVDYEMYIN